MSDNTNDKIIDQNPEEAVPQDEMPNIDNNSEIIEETEENNEIVSGDVPTEDADLDASEDISEEASDDVSEDVYEEDYEEYEETSYDESFDRGILHKLARRINEYVFFLKNTEPQKRLRIISAISACVLVVILVLTDLIPILPNAYNRFYVGNSFVIGETQGGVYDKLGKNVIYAGNGSIMSFGPDMSCNFKIESVTGTPRLETAGRNAIVYYRNSNAVYVVSNDTHTQSLTAGDTVTGATVNSKGYYGLITDESGYKSCVDIYNPGGKSVYKWHTNNPVIDVSVSDNGSYMVASSYTADNSLMSGKLIFFDLGQDQPVKEVVTNSNIISEVKFINDDVVVVFGDLYTAAYTGKGVMKWRIDYSGRTLKSYDISENGEIAFIFDRYSSELSESTVEIYNSSGRLKGRYESKDNIKYVSANNNCYLLSLDRKTVLLDADADVMKRRSSVKEFRKAVLYHNYNFAFSVSDSIAEIMSVNH